MSDLEQEGGQPGPAVADVDAPEPGSTVQETFLEQECTVIADRLAAQDFGAEAAASTASSSESPSTLETDPAAGQGDDRRQICFDFTKGVCSRGASCKYSHSVEHIIAVNSEEKGICFDFLKGLCNRGLMCRFSHDLSNLQPPQEATGGRRKYAPICYDFVKNQCSRGDECRYSHDYASIFYGPRSSGKNLNVICVDYTRGRCMRGDSCRYFHPPGTQADPSAFVHGMAHMVAVQQNPALWSSAANPMATVLPYGHPAYAHGYAPVPWDGNPYGPVAGPGYYAMPPYQQAANRPVHQSAEGPSAAYGNSAQQQQQQQQQAGQLLRQLQELVLSKDAAGMGAPHVGSQGGLQDQASASLLAALGRGYGPQGVSADASLGVPGRDLGHDGLGFGGGPMAARANPGPGQQPGLEPSAALRAVAAALAAAERLPEGLGPMPELADQSGGVGVAVAAAPLPRSDLAPRLKPGLEPAAAALDRLRASGADLAQQRGPGLAGDAGALLVDKSLHRAKHAGLLASSRTGSADLSPTISAGWHTDASAPGALHDATALHAPGGRPEALAYGAPRRQPSSLLPLHVRLAREAGSGPASGAQTPLPDGAMTMRPGDAADDRVGLELLQSIWALHGVQGG